LRWGFVRTTAFWVSPDDFACTILRTITHTFRRTIDELVTLKQLCAEMKINPREARERLRLAVRDAKKNPASGLYNFLS
jgi:hypothetical protein